VSDGAFTEATMHLAPGELLLLYTDGVIEVKPSDLDLGERELRATLAAHAGAPPDEIVAAVERRVVDLQSGTPRDDIVLVAIHVPGDDESQATVGP
jgi:serine phosphatase RsbU (regulator of sigma subunit)